VQLKKNNTFYYWASDIRFNSGEGILANLFIADIKKNFKQSSLVNINNKKDNYSKLYNKYILNLIGAIKLWKYYFQGHKTIYINYLPIWNFTIFLILPPKTIIGPITGSLIYNKHSLLDTFIRGLLLNIFKKISLLIIFFRQKKILFSTNLLQECIKKNQLNRVYFNYIVKHFKGFAKKKFKKDIDFLIYHRLHNNKNNSMIKYFINNTINKKYKIFVFGDPIKSKNIKNLGYISKNKVNLLLSRAKFTFGSSENLYTLFLLDSISRDVVIFYDKSLKKFNNAIQYKKMIPIDYNNKEKSLRFVVDNLKNLKKNNKNYFKKNNDSGYFKQYL
jgi:hypothetical protein